MEVEERLASLFHNKVDLPKWFMLSVLTLQELISRFQFLCDKVPFFPIDAHIYISNVKQYIHIVLQ